MSRQSYADGIKEMVAKRNKSIVAEDGRIKSAVDCIPAEALLEVGKVMAFGAEKYEVDLWLKRPTSQRKRYASALRHLYSWKAGECEDPESGLCHIDHAITQLLMLRTYMLKGIE